MASTRGVKEGVLLGMGNPLLDIQVTVDETFIKEHELQRDAQILAEERHLKIFDEIRDRKGVRFIPGGATQNALRIFQWIIKEPKRSTFFGSVGDDDYAQILQREADRAGVDVHYQQHKGTKTGTCAALINDHHRSLIAHLAAAEKFTVDHIRSAENQARISKADYYYISGFFITPDGSMDAIMEVAKHAAEHNKRFMMNIGADFVPTFFLERFQQVLPYIDVLFGNEKEYLAFAKAAKLGTEDMKEVAKKIASLSKVNKQRKRTVVITQGPDPVIVSQDGELKEFSVPKLDAIVDSNGAGDAFCGGYIAELIKGRSLEACIKCGCFAAGVVLRNDGCTFPEKCDYNGA